MRIARAALFVAAAVSTAQTPCPPIQFQQAAITRLNGTPDLRGTNLFVRQKDGGYALTTYDSNSSFVFVKSGVVPDAQQALALCYGGPARSFTTSAALAPPAARLGLYAVEAVWADFNRDGIGAGAGVYERLSSNGVVYGNVGADLNPKPHVIYPTGENPILITVADFNGDSRPDIAALNYGPYSAGQASVSILLNNGDGAFRPALTTSLGGSPQSMTAFDWNGDGKIDLAITTLSQQGSTPSQVVILLGNGDGSFRAGQPIPLAAYASTVIAGDFNADGKPDLAVGTQDSTVLLLPGNGDGTFRAAVKTTLPAPVRYLASGDFNKDGRLDLVVSYAVSNLLGVLSGDGNFNFPTRSHYQAEYSTTTIQVADLDHDGNQDIILGSGDPSALAWNPNSGNLVVYYGRGDGTFYGTLAYDVGAAAAVPAIADFNGDGLPDAVSMASDGTLLVLLSQAGGGFKTVPRATTSISSAKSLAAADFNRDGKADVLVASSAAGLLLLPGQGDGTFGAKSTISSETGYTTVAVGDLNGDGRADFVAAGPDSGKAGVFLAGATGAFNAPLILTPGTKPSSVAIADLNGDSKPDLIFASAGVVGGAAGSLAIYLGNGDGTFRAPSSFAVGANPYFVTAVDANGDNRPDLFVLTRTADFGWNLVLLKGLGNGNFAAPEVLKTDFGPGEIVLGDFSGDGKPDLLVAHCCGDTQMGFYLGNGDGTFAAERLMTASSNFTTIKAVDFDQDGRLDVIGLASDSSIGTLFPLRNVGPRTGPLAVLSAASFLANPAPPDSIVSLFGSSLASGVTQNTQAEPPLQLGGVSAVIRDMTGKTALMPLFFTAPGQVNALVPAGLANGPAIVQVTTAAGALATGETRIADTAPALFTLNAAGLVAANLLRVSAGVQTYEPVYDVDASGAVVARAIDFGAATDQLYLVLYGTGLRGQKTKPSVSVAIGTRGYPVVYSGAQGQFPGLDQVNVQLNRAALAGAGELSISVNVNFNTSNVAKVRFK